MRFTTSDGEVQAIQFVIPFRFADLIWPSGTWIVILSNGRRVAQTTEQLDVMRSRFFRNGAKTWNS